MKQLRPAADTGPGGRGPGGRGAGCGGQLDAVQSLLTLPVPWRGEGQQLGEVTCLDEVAAELLADLAVSPVLHGLLAQQRRVFPLMMIEELGELRAAALAVAGQPVDREHVEGSFLGAVDPLLGTGGDTLADDQSELGGAEPVEVLEDEVDPIPL